MDTEGPKPDDKAITDVPTVVAGEAKKDGDGNQEQNESAPTIPADVREELITRAKNINKLGDTVVVGGKPITTATIVGTPADRAAKELNIKVKDKQSESASEVQPTIPPDIREELVRKAQLTNKLSDNVGGVTTAEIPGTPANQALSQLGFEIHKKE